MDKGKEQTGQTKEPNDAGWFVWESDELLTTKQWTDLLLKRLKMDERQMYRLNEFLEHFGLIDGPDDSVVKIRLPFAFSKDKELVYILIPHQDGDKTEYVRYAIRIME